MAVQCRTRRRRGPTIELEYSLACEADEGDSRELALSLRAAGGVTALSRRAKHQTSQRRTPTRFDPLARCHAQRFEDEDAAGRGVTRLAFGRCRGRVSTARGAIVTTGLASQTSCYDSAELALCEEERMSGEWIW